MPFPIVPLGVILAIAGASYIAGWYNGSSKKTQKKADEIGSQLAREMFGIPPDQLTEQQAVAVLDRVKSQIS